MDKPKEPLKIIEFDKATSQLHVRVETENDLIAKDDKTKKIGFSRNVLKQTIHKSGIQEILNELEDQKVKHDDNKLRATHMLDAEVVALDMIDKDIKNIREAIGDLKFEEEKDEPETSE